MSRLSTWWHNLSQKRQDTLLIILVTLVALLPRLPGLDLFLTADEPKSWFGRSIQFLDALARADWAATFDSPAPGVTTMWAGSMGLLLDYARQGFPGGSLTAFLANVPFDPLDPTILPLIRLPIVLISALAVILTYIWGRAVLGRFGALAAAFLLALDPFLLALTRMLGHDGLVAVFMWLSLLAFLRASPLAQPSTLRLRSGQVSHLPISPSPLFNRRFLLISGALGGLAFLTKYPSLFLGAFIALTLLILHLRNAQFRWQTLRAWLVDVALWSIAAGAVFALLWPAMWINPIGQVMIIINDALRASSSPHPKGSFFMGQPVPDPGSLFYLVVTFFKTTPILWLGWLLAIIGLITNRRKDTAQTRWQRTAFILLAFAAFYGLLITVGGKKQDRYILPSFPALTALAALGYTYLWSKIRQQNFLTRILRWAIPIVILFQAVLIFPYHPYYFTYYAPVLGGGPAAARTMIVGWGEGLDQAARWLNSQPNAQNTDVVAWYSTTFEPYFNGNAIYKIDEEKISRSPKPGLSADYVVLYINQIQRELPSIGALQHFRAVPPAHTVTLNGLDYAWIYPSVKMQHVFGNEARLVGQAELLGFNLLSESGDPVPTNHLPANQPATVQLYWEWQGKSPDELIGLNLVDYNGQIWGATQALGTQARFPFEQWQEGMVAHDDFVLNTLPGIPPGDYYLKAWIDRPATGERVGDFPLLLEETQLSITRPATPWQPSDLALATQLNLSIANNITLLGFVLSNSPNSTNSSNSLNLPNWSPGERRDLTLYWQADQQINQNYPVTLKLVDTIGTTRAEWSGLPAAGIFPSNRWQPGDVIRDPWLLTLPSYAPPGDYRLTAQLGNTPPVELLAVTVEGRPRLFDAPPLDMALNAQFGESIHLLGLQSESATGSALEIAPGRSLQLSLVWQAGDLIDADYTTTVQLLDAQQQVHAQRDGAPMNGAAPTTSWAGGEVVIDDITLDIPAEVEPGPHQLLIALYSPNSGQRLLLPNGQDHLTIPVDLVNSK